MATLITLHPGSRAHPNRGHNSIGSSAEQTSGGCPPWKILARCNYLRLSRSGTYNFRRLILQVSVSSSVWFGRCCGHREGSIQGQEFRFLDNTQRFRWLEESLSSRLRVCKIVLLQELFKLSGKLFPTRHQCDYEVILLQNLQAIEELRQQFLGYLIDSSFIRVEKEYIRELSRWVDPDSLG